MNPKPIADLPAPAYPTRRELLAKGTLIFLAASCGGCGRIFESHPVVAPVFEHGEGRAYMGCVTVASPVFLSEEEALQIIKEELAKEGITLGSGMPLAGVKVEFKESQSLTDHWLGEKRESRLIPASLDAVDRNRKVGIQYVSSEDNEKVERFCDSYSTQFIAKRFAEEFQAQAKDDLYIGVFYDPMTSRERLSSSNREEIDTLAKTDLSEDEKSKRLDEVFERSWKKRDRAALAKSKDLLRQQAQDFIAWLKRQQTG